MIFIFSLQIYSLNPQKSLLLFNSKIVSFKLNKKTQNDSTFVPPIQNSFQYPRFILHSQPLHNFPNRYHILTIIIPIPKLQAFGNSFQVEQTTTIQYSRNLINHHTTIQADHLRKKILKFKTQ